MQLSSIPLLSIVKPLLCTNWAEQYPNTGYSADTMPFLSPKASWKGFRMQPPIMHSSTERFLWYHSFHLQNPVLLPGKKTYTITQPLQVPLPHSWLIKRNQLLKWACDQISWSMTSIVKIKRENKTLQCVCLLAKSRSITGSIAKHHNTHQKKAKIPLFC
jgi:hypothetical protein